MARDAHWAAKMARLRARQLPEHTLHLCDDPAVKKRLDQAKLEPARLRMADAEAGREPSEETVAARAALEDAQAAFDAVTVSLTFGDAAPVLDGLIKEHPPTEEQGEDGDAWNPETFPASLIAAAHIERDDAGRAVEGMSPEEAQDLLDSWSAAESNALFSAAWHGAAAEPGVDGGCGKRLISDPQFPGRAGAV